MNCLNYRLILMPSETHALSGLEEIVNANNKKACAGQASTGFFTNR
jgi:hypothetical protein